MMCGDGRWRAARTLIALRIGFSVLLLIGCGQREQADHAGQANAPAARQAAPTLDPPAATGTRLFLAQAQFKQVVGEDGKTRPVPGPARLLIYTRGDNGWTEEVLEDPDSNVFHKAAWMTPVEGDPGILTIGAVKAHLKLWRHRPQGWVGESLWNPSFGGTYDRLRDFEVGDLDGDGKQEIVVATHDQGVVGIVAWKGGAYKAEAIAREKNTFVHEIELGDVDGDGTLEIFATPSHPNKMDGSVQPGAIDMFTLKDGKWIQKRVDTLETRHAKEVLAATLDGETRAVLFASLEGERIGGGTPGGDTTRIRLYRFEGKEISRTDIAGLPGKLCRFLTWGDTNGDGKHELIAFTKSSGIWKLEPPEGTTSPLWRKQLIAAGTSGYEHSAFLFDANDDGKQEIYVASDDQKELRSYWFDGSAYQYEVLGKLKDHTITWNVTAHARQ